MGRPQESIESKLDEAIKVIAKGILIRDHKKVICLACSENVNYMEKKPRQSLKQHIETSKHIAKLKRFKDEKQKQLLISDMPSSKKDFNYRLVKAFAMSDIPLHKLNCKPLKGNH